jgi:hypothetical protein
MDVGSVEYAVIAFPGNQFKGEIIPAIRELVDNGIVRVLDIAFVMKDENGEVEAVELSAMPDSERQEFQGIVSDWTPLLNDDDFEDIAADLDDNSSAGLIVWENLWSSRFAEAVGRADGVLLANEKIPQPVVKAAMEYADDQKSQSAGAA